MSRLDVMDDFGAVGNRIANDSPKFQAAINQVRTAGHGTIYIPNPPVGYRLDDPLDVTGTSGIRFVGEGGNNPSRALLYPYHTGHVFDCADSSFLSFEDIFIRPLDPAVKPKTGWFMARNAAKDGAGQHYFKRCGTFGKFSGASVYQYGSESNEYYCNYFANEEWGAKAFMLTAHNILNLSSDFITIATGACANIDIRMFGGSLYAKSSDDANVSGNVIESSAALYIEAAALVNLFSTWMACSNGTHGGQALIVVDTTNSPSNNLHFNGLIGEKFGGEADPRHVAYFGGGPAICLDVLFTGGCRASSKVNTIYGTDDVEFDGLEINNLNDVGDSPRSSIYSAKNSIIRGGSHTIRHRVDYSTLVSAAGAFSLPALRAGTVVYDPTTGSFDPLRAGTLTATANPADVSVPHNTPTPLFNAQEYLGGGQSMEFEVFDDNSISCTGRVRRTPTGTAYGVSKLEPSLGAGIAFAMGGVGGKFVYLTHTVGSARNVSIRMRPATSSGA